ncbi:hypothetical protein N1851_026544 [Merluccius polli]|uniref:Reverse transcriptase domain-containing protein n=1 Tax=Merluccius polli TaxID=89951 RepID=A0AA47MBT9_MERPO|nr:hypothetical protein N1851_026544 [Merluccius polli]
MRRRGSLARGTRRSCVESWLRIRKGKDNYRRKLEKRLEQNNARDIWRGLQTIAGYGKGVGRDQASRDKDWADDLNLTGAPQGTVLSPFFFTLYTSDFTHNTSHCHIQKFSDDTAIVGCVSEGNNLEYRTVIRDFVSWNEQNQLQLNTSKTKEMIVNFRRKASHFTSGIS